MLHSKNINGATDSISVPHSRGGSAPNAAPFQGTPLANNLRAEGEAGVHPLYSVSPTFPCPECEGTGFFTSGNFHPDDPRCEATWDCENCGATGEVDYETPPPAPRNLPTMEEVQSKIAEVFNPLWKPKDWERIEL